MQWLKEESNLLITTLTSSPAMQVPAKVISSFKRPEHWSYNRKLPVVSNVMIISLILRFFGPIYNRGNNNETNYKSNCECYHKWEIGI